MTRDKFISWLTIIEKMAIICGILLAVYELYINRIYEEVAEEVRTYDVASRLFEYEPMRDFLYLATEYVEDKTAEDFSKLSPDEADEIKKRYQ